MGKNSFRLIFFIFVFVSCLYLSISSCFAAKLHWDKVDDSPPDCIIKGYKIHYGTSQGVYPRVMDVGNVLSCDLEFLKLIPPQRYFFAVSAYSETSQDGPLSAPVSYFYQYRDSPNIVTYPSIDRGASAIDVIFNETDMQGAAIKGNYEFSPTLVFDEPAIVLTNGTYKLFFDFIPALTIFTMTVTNVTDNKGYELFSGSIVINDDNNNTIPDDWEIDYGVYTVSGSGSDDLDSDGLDNKSEYILGTNPKDNDSDDDGMADGWEVRNGLNPIVDDANEDLDGDGISNKDEYAAGTDVTNRCPEKPILSLPAQSSLSIHLKPELVTNAYVDSEKNEHLKTQWQISAESSFSNEENILFNQVLYDSLTRLSVPEFILDPNKTYYWRVRFFDILDGGSLWSDPFSFTTLTMNPDDLNGNGVPDVQQVTDLNIDLNDDGHPDVYSDTYKMVTHKNLFIGLEASGNVTGIDYLKYIDPDAIADTSGKPSDLDFGLIGFKVSVDSPGDTVQLKVCFSKSVGTTWHKYDLINGWSEYSKEYPGNVLFSLDGKSVLLRLVDGGAGDSDGAANGIIVDPSGPGAVDTISSSSSSNAVDSSSGGGGGGCFIATAAFGSYMESHVQILKDFRDKCLLKSRAGTLFVKAYYRYSPPLADIIAKNSLLRAFVRVSLMPLIGFGYIAVHTSLPEQGMMLVFVLGAGVYIIRKKWYCRQV